MESLLDQKLAPGSRVVAEQLREELGVSITPLREALARLESDALIRKQPHKGYVVSPMLDLQGFESLYDMRLILEPEAAARAAKRASEGDLVDLRRHAEAMHGALTGNLYREFSEFAKADASFHQSIAKSTQNEYLVESVDRLRAHLHLSRLYAGRGVVDAHEALPEHDAMVVAISQGDGRSARKLMTDHIERSRHRLRLFIESRDTVTQSVPPKPVAARHQHPL